MCSIVNVDYSDFLKVNLCNACREKQQTSTNVYTCLSFTSQPLQSAAGSKIEIPVSASIC